MVAHPRQGQQQQSPAYSVKATTIPAGEGAEQNQEVSLETHTSSKEVSSSNKKSPSAGQLRLYRDQWAEITSDKFILEAISGHKIEFSDELKTPAQNKVLSEYKRNKAKQRP